MFSNKNFFFIAGMPRSGSTVLSALLHQNPNIHAEGMSAVCQLMWDANVSCRDNCAEALISANRGQSAVDIISAIPKIYYKNVQKSIIVDKNRNWCHPANVEIIKRFITPTPKIIVLDRELDDVVRSFIELGRRNNVEIPESELRKKGTNPIMSCYQTVQLARKNNNGEFLFVDFDKFISNPRKTVDEIYGFCGWSKFEHNFANIELVHKDVGGVYLLDGLHETRPLINA